MNSVQTHYQQHLGPVYEWMVGGFDDAVQRGTQEVERLADGRGSGHKAVDLGAGFGMYAIPLAQRGFDVLAIDSCSTLVDRMKSENKNGRINVIEDDLFSFQKHLANKVDLALCMTDTLTHLASNESVAELSRLIFEHLNPGGIFAATFRDYTTALQAEHRFIPVRSDRNRIFCCFLEYERSHVVVNDILYEWAGTEWNSSVSAYRKLRISPDWFLETLNAVGFGARQEKTPGGMVRFIAERI